MSERGVFFPSICKTFGFFITTQSSKGTKVRSTGVKQDQRQHSSSKTMPSDLEFYCSMAAWWATLGGTQSGTWLAAMLLSVETQAIKYTATGKHLLPQITDWEPDLPDRLTARHPGQTAAIREQGQFHDPYLPTPFLSQQDIPKLTITKTLSWWIQFWESEISHLLSTKVLIFVCHGFHHIFGFYLWLNFSFSCLISFHQLRNILSIWHHANILTQKPFRLVYRWLLLF